MKLDESKYDKFIVFFLVPINFVLQQNKLVVFRIHTRRLREGGFLDETISLSEYAKRTKNYTGAEIEGVVRSAISYAMRENVDPDNLNNIDTRRLKNLKIKKEYFELALGKNIINLCYVIL